MRSSLDYAWQEQSVWSQVANRLRAQLRTKRRVGLSLTIAGGVLSTTAAGIGLDTSLGRAFAFAAAVCVGAAAIAQSTAGTNAVRDWTRARSAAEAIKSEVYLALAGVGAADLDAEIKRIGDDAGDLRAYQAGIRPVSRPLPPVTDPGTYLHERVDQQIKWYHDNRAAKLTVTLRRYRYAEWGLAGVGLLLGAGAGTWEISWMAMWVPVVTTIGAAVLAHAAAERYSYLLIEYMRTGDELRRLRNRVGPAASLSDQELVRRAEAVISAQNEGWMAKQAGDTSA
jgi:hypothetical protein